MVPKLMKFCELMGAGHSEAHSQRTSAATRHQGVPQPRGQTDPPSASNASMPAPAVIPATRQI